MRGEAGISLTAREVEHRHYHGAVSVFSVFTPLSNVTLFGTAVAFVLPRRVSARLTVYVQNHSPFDLTTVFVFAAV